MLKARIPPQRASGTRSNFWIKAADYDQVFAWVVLLLLLAGVVMVYSASIALPDAPKYATYKPIHFLARQAIFVVIALMTARAVIALPIAFWQKWSVPLFLATLGLLALMLLPGFGKGVNGARRWLSAFGINLQPSELMKLAMVLYAAGYAVRRQFVLYSLTRGFGPIPAAVAVVGLLLLLEPDLGAFGVIVAITLELVMNQ